VKRTYLYIIKGLDNHTSHTHKTSATKGLWTTIHHTQKTSATKG